MRKFVAVIAVVMLLPMFALPALAQVVVTPAPAVVYAGSAFYDLLLGYAGIIGTIVATLASWALWKFTGIKIEANYRTALETFVNNAAGAFLVRFDNLKQAGNINVGNEAIAALANGALQRIPDTLGYFKLTPQDLQRRIIEKIGILTAVPAPSIVPSVQPSMTAHQ